MKPFDSWDLNFLYVVNESTILSAFIITTAFMLNYDENEGSIICNIKNSYLPKAWSLIVVISLDVVINLGFVVYDLIRKFKKLYKKLLLKYKIR